MKILTPIENFNVSNTLTVNQYPTSGTIYKDAGPNRVTSAPFNAGVLFGNANALGMYQLGSTNLYKIISDISHTSTTGTTYNVTVTNADTYPIITFEMTMRKFTDASPAFPLMRFNSDSGSNYARRAIYQNGSLNHLADTYTSCPLAEVYSNVSSNFTNTGYSCGTAYLKSGTMRSVLYESSQSFSGSTGFVTYHIKWTNTASVITSINLIVPNNIYFYSKIYQQVG